MDRAVEGRVALVTGASRGIGAAIARRLAEEGARVAVSARTLEPDARYEGSLQQVVEEISKAGGEAVAVRCDLSEPDDRRRMVDETVDALGPIDILVNNAAVTFFQPFADFPEKRWRLMFEVQVRAPYELAQIVTPSMRERGQGWILNISSRAANHPVGPPFDLIHKSNFTVYGMVKAALDRFSTALAAELYDDNIAVNALSPWDNVDTPGAGHHDLVEGFRLEGVEWMAEAALQLCSHQPQQLTGRVAYSQPLLAELQLRPSTRA
jgi:NAD(P)-dependent dehydrogenase (short-subunit alcohol dehydrogenase family)